MSKTAIILPVYNTADRALTLVQHIQQYVRLPYKMFVIDNGSYDPVRFATHRIEHNDGMGAAIRYITDRLSDDYEFYWILSTSLEFGDWRGDPLAELQRLYREHDGAVSVGAGWVGNMVSWPHKKMLFTGEDHEVDMTALPAIWDAHWWRGVDGFDYRLCYGWGSDFELSYKARQTGRTFWVSGNLWMRILEGATYHGNHDALMEYHQRAGDQMRRVLSDKYGREWEGVLLSGVQHG